MKGPKMILTDALPYNFQKTSPELQYLYDLYRSGGPSTDEYDTLTKVIAVLVDHCKSGKIPGDSLEQFKRVAGGAWSTTYTMQGFSTVKPNGYAGCFETIERIYTRWLSPVPFLRKWDEYFHAQPAAEAVRNRAGVLDAIIASLGDKEKITILNLGCGPGLEFVTALLQHSDKIDTIDFVDTDKAALERSKQNLSVYTDKIRFIKKNVVRFTSDSNYDLIWSSGLFDYLNDALFVAVLRRLRKMLRKDGRIVIGNFSTGNPTKAYMDFVDWKLIHRTEDQLATIARYAKMSDAVISTESTTVNLFLDIRE